MLQYNRKGNYQKKAEFFHSISQFPQESKQSNALNLVNVAGLFYILIGGLALALFTAVLELLVKANNEARKTRVKKLNSLGV